MGLRKGWLGFGKGPMEEGVGVMVDGVGVSGSLGRGDENIAAPVMVRGRA